MKKKVIFRSAIGVILLITLVNLQLSFTKNNSEVRLKNALVISLANAEDVPTINCPGGESECARVTTNGGTLVYYKK